MPPPFDAWSHQNFMQSRNGLFNEYWIRQPSEPSPPPIQEPNDPPENPVVPVREPDPDDPAQI